MYCVVYRNYKHVRTIHSYLRFCDISHTYIRVDRREKDCSVWLSLIVISDGTAHKFILKYAYIDKVFIQVYIIASSHHFFMLFHLWFCLLAVNYWLNTDYQEWILSYCILVLCGVGYISATYAPIWYSLFANFDQLIHSHDNIAPIYQPLHWSDHIFLPSVYHQWFE